ncbi:MAG: IS1182 family transposase, partial [Phycisphaerales bacterium]
NHILRQINETLDLDFVYDQVKDCYGRNGNVSVPPPVVLKMMLLLFLYNVRSERELMDTIAYRLDWMWFLGYDIDSDIPNHSVLSKARARWGVDVFQTLFARVVYQCVQAGLVNGRKIHIDGSLIDANASNNSVVKGPEKLIGQLKQQLQSENAKLDEPLETKPAESAEESEEDQLGTKKYYQRKNKGMVSTTDPDAAIVRKGRLGPKPRFKAHRVVDDQCGITTATETTSGDVEENAKLFDLVDQHEQNTHYQVDTVVTDKQYGTADNFRKCHQRGIRSHMGDFMDAQEKRGNCQDIFDLSEFTYDSERDIYTCPAGQTLTSRKHKKQRQAYEYACPSSVCRACSIRQQCTRAKNGVARTIKRHYDEESIEAAREQSHSQVAKRDRVRRKWLMEGSFGDATLQHGFKRARWRRLWRQQIQDYLIATIQNLRILVRHTYKPAKTCSKVSCCLSIKVFALAQELIARLRLFKIFAAKVFRIHPPRVVAPDPMQ